MVVDESKIPFGGDTGRVKSYISNNRVTNLDEVGEALNFGAFSTLLAGVCVYVNIAYVKYLYACECV